MFTNRKRKSHLHGKWWKRLFLDQKREQTGEKIYSVCEIWESSFLKSKFQAEEERKQWRQFICGNKRKFSKMKNIKGTEPHPTCLASKSHLKRNHILLYWNALVKMVSCKLPQTINRCHRNAKEQIIFIYTKLQ